MSGSPAVQVVVDPTQTGASVLRAAASFAGIGLMDAKRRIAAGQPVITEEMFTNAWYDERAEKLLLLLSRWQNDGVAFEVVEVPEPPHAGNAAAITLDVLRNIVEAASGDGVT